MPASEREEVEAVHEHLEDREDRDQEPADKGDPANVALDVPVFVRGASGQWDRDEAARRRTALGSPTRPGTDGAGLLRGALLGDDRCLELRGARLLLGRDRRRGPSPAALGARDRSLQRASLAGPTGEA